LKHLVCRVDGSSKVGIGHIMRCVALAEMLRDEFEITFVMFMPDEEVKKIVKAYNLPLIILTEQKDTSYIDDSDIIVLDGYWFDNNYVRLIKNKNKKVIQIDDLVGSEFFADIVINHAIGVDYSKSVLQGTKKILVGNDYALLRKEFLAFDSKKKESIGFNNITINMGGADPQNYTLKLLKALKDTPSEIINVHVLIGNAYSFKDQLKTWIAQNGHFNIALRENLNAAEIILLFKSSSLFICPASTVVYEAAATGVPIGCFLTADNQKNIYDGLVKTRSVFPLGDLQNLSDVGLVNTLKNLFKEYRADKKRTDHTRTLIDGLSGKRIKEEILGLWN
jgi:UDP-2,4-diacetamido-2,4,6-trideoxy-beta-L-altropyranose hydrolase